MTDRLDALTPIPGKDGKTFFRRIGTAWPMKNGGWSISLDALPLPSLNEGKLETRILLMPPKESGNEPF